MRRDVSLLGFIAAVFVLSALLAPPLFWAAQALANAWPAAHGLADVAFPRLVSRLTLAIGLLGLWPFQKWIRASSRELGWSSPDWANLARGAVLALVTLGGFLLLTVLVGARTWRPHEHAGDVLRVVGLAVAGAVLVAPLEELVFRGVVFGLLRPPPPRSWWPALVISSVFFGVMHFLQRAPGIPGTHWSSGFEALGQMLNLTNIGGSRALLLLNLSLCGAILAWTYQCTGTLWFSIGLHAGWIFSLKLATALTIASSGQNVWGTRRLIDGWGATILLGVTLGLVVLLTRRTTTLNHADSDSPIVADVG